MNKTKFFCLSPIRLTFLLSFFSLLLAAIAPAWANAPDKEDRTLSPYFFVRSDNAAVDQLPLKATATQVQIAGIIADVTVTQTYANTGKTPLEATYVFPASTRAAVHGMKMTIGERVVAAKIEKREDARRQYEEAKQQGKSASLLEQQRPNVFQMNLANILPGDEIRVEMRYTELIVPEDGVYEFVYPTVVGPRYSNLPQSKATPADQWVANPTLRQGEAPTSTFDIAVDIAGGMPIKDAACPSHKTQIAFDGPHTASVRLDPLETHGGNRDFILRYRLDGNRIQSGLLLQPAKAENYFLLTLQPPKRVAAENIPGREYVFIVDVSGSMHGFPLDVSKELLRDLIGKLRPSDRFNVLLFSGGSAAMAEESLPATPQNIKKAIDLIDNQKGGGGTELLPALKHALALKASKGFSRTVVIVTDGYVTVEEEVFDLIRNNLDRANMFAFGIGSSVNRHIIEGMARIGQGEPFVITAKEAAKGEAERFRKMIASPVLTGIQVRFDGFDAYDVEPLKAPDILAERPLVVFGKWRGQPSGKIKVSGVSGQGAFSETVDVEKYAPAVSALQTPALGYLWARQRITLLSDYNKLRGDDKRIAEVTDLGLKYGLLTAYTSFIAVDSLVRNQAGDSAKVTQPLPMPQGVSDLAVGGQGRAHMSAMAAIPAPEARGSRPASSPNPFAGKITIAADALFDFDSAVLRPEAKKKLEELAAKAKAMHLMEVILAVGHADRLEGKGKPDKAQILSEQRAAAVKAYMVSLGIDARRIYTEGKGSRQPVTGEKCAGPKNAKAIACLQPDRRVDVEMNGH